MQRDSLLPVERAAAAATVVGHKRLDVDLVVAPGQGLAAAVRRVTDLGGRVLLQDTRIGYLQAEMPVDTVLALGDLPGLRAMGADGPAHWRPMAEMDGGAPVPGKEAAAEFGANLEAIRQPELVAATGATGRGAVIAVIDTGVDVGHPALQSGDDGAPKIVDWRDFSGEGDVDTTLALQPVDGVLTVPSGRRYDVRGIPTASGVVHFGILAESRLDTRSPGLQGDLNHNAQITDAYGVLATDSTTPGLYDTVYVDSNNSGNFADKRPLVPWRQGQSFARSGGRFGGGVSTNQLELSTNFAIADLTADGNSVSIGFDGYGHGTAVAAVAAGFDPEPDSGFRGVAPGAQIMALKVWGSSGLPMDGSRAWNPIAAAMTYAAQHGAKIINLSAANLDTDLHGELDMSAFMRALVQQYGVLIVLAAGNEGPGLSSGLTPGDEAYVLTVGAYASPDMWQRYRGLTVPSEVLLSFSGVGPRLDGTLVPSLVAPGMAAPALPRWQSSSGYYLQRGTSEAVPHVTGGAALLLDAAKRAGQRLDYSSLKRGLEMGARALDGYQVIEQGHGLVNLEKAWLLLQQLHPNWPLDWSLGADPAQHGVLARGETPGDFNFTLVNKSDRVRRVGIVTDAPWLQPQRGSLTLPPGRARNLPVGYVLPAGPGLYSGLISLTDPDAGGPVAQMISTVVAPYTLGPDNAVHLVAQLSAAHYDRRFIQIPNGMSQFNLDFGVPVDGSGKPLGRAQVRVFRPDGHEVYTGPVVGAGESVVRDRFLQRNPLPGLWEVVSVAPEDLSAYNLDRTPVDFTLTAQGFGVGELPIRLRFARGGMMAKAGVPITNLGPSFSGNVEASGLTARDESLPSQVVRADFFDKFELSAGSPLMRIELSGVRPAGSQVLATVSHLNLVTQDYEQVMARTLIGPALTLDVPDAPAGTWAVTLVPLKGADPKVQYSRTVVSAGQDLSAQDTPRLHAAGQTWNVPLQVEVPAQPGRYVGTLRVRDSSGERLAVLPVEVDVGQPEMEVRVLPSELVQGQRGFVTLEVRDAGTGALIRQPVGVEVDGRVHQLTDGRLTVPVMVAIPDLGFDVSITSPPAPYLPFRAHLGEAVAAVRASVPVGVTAGAAAGDDLPAWRQKVATESQPAGG